MAAVWAPGEMANSSASGQRWYGPRAPPTWTGACHRASTGSNDADKRRRLGAYRQGHVSSDGPAGGRPSFLTSAVGADGRLTLVAAGQWTAPHASEIEPLVEEATR